MTERIKHTDLINSAAVVADETSEIVDISYISGYCVQIVWTSTTCVASIKLQESIDGLTWVDVTDGAQAVANNSGASILSFIGVMAPKVRVVVDWTSGSLTTVTVKLHAKNA